MMYKKWVVERKRAELTKIAKNLFEATGKNPYYRGGKAIKNFRELWENLAEFTENEAQWVAAWIDYLGDARTAARIRERPSKFKELINERYAELRRYVG
ncbi:MAG: hypothetical protein QMD95_02875 [Candidatus Hodarchaeaceae archaeon]|nr:hypothetical protein [Candidatus Hodarchaeaceae archaeon]